MGEAAQQYQQTRQAGAGVRRIPYETTTGSWSQARRVVAKAEYIDGKENPRYVVTSLSGGRLAGAAAV